MLLFDILDFIINFTIRAIPIIITLVSSFIAYYFYKKNVTSKENYQNYFKTRQCYLKNNKCQFDLSKNIKFECPLNQCNEKFINSNDYYCYDNLSCIKKKKNFLDLSKNNCGKTKISNFPNKIYKSYDECYNNNLSQKSLNKKNCLKLPHGYGWSLTKGCIKANPDSELRYSSDFLDESSLGLYIPSNPNPYILQNFNLY